MCSKHHQFTYKLTTGMLIFISATRRGTKRWLSLLECVAAENRFYLLCALSTLIIRVISTSRMECKKLRHHVVVMYIVDRVSPWRPSYEKEMKIGTNKASWGRGTDLLAHILHVERWDKRLQLHVISRLGGQVMKEKKGRGAWGRIPIKYFNGWLGVLWRINRSGAGLTTVRIL